MRPFLTLLLSVWIFLSGSVAYSTTIIIHNQNEFDRIQERIIETVSAGRKDITVRIGPGSFFFRDNHLRLCGLDWQEVSLHLEGVDCILTGSGPVYHSGEPFGESFSGWETLLDDDGVMMDWFGKSRKCLLPVEVVGESEGLCRIKTDGLHDRKEEDCLSTFIKLTEWYRSSIYPVQEIRNGYIYFKADDLSRVSPTPFGYNVNYDLIYGRKLPRYRLCNVQERDKGQPDLRSGHLYLPEGCQQARLCKSGCFLDIADVRLKSLKITGITFRGNSRHANPSLIRFDKLSCTAGSEIAHCTFQSIRSYLFHGRDMAGFYFHDNLIQDCPGFGLVSDIRTSGTRIENNRFQDTGKDGQPSFCVQISGDDYLIRGNSFKNFGYSAIAVGLGPEIDYPGTSRGIIEHNEMSYDEEYLSQIDRYGLMDSGVIYLTTRQNGTLVRYNRITNIGGIKDNRGIFCDDGARNFILQSNTILGISNSYGIDSRRVADFEEKCGPTNINISILENITDSPIRFEGHPGKNGCKLGVQYLRKNDKGFYPAIHSKNISHALKAVKE